MYAVSEEYQSKMLDQIQTHKLIGTCDGVSFDESNVIGVSITNRCADKKVNLGSVNIGTLKLTFLTDILDRGEYYGKTIILSDSLYLGLDENDEEIWETVPVGVFYIASATWTAAGIDVTAYDVLSKLDETLDISETTSKIYGFCTYIATKTNTVFGMTELECDALPNGTEAISPYEDANLETYRDLLSALTQMIGGFAYAARDGSWKLRPFDDVSVITIPKNRRMSGSSFSDFETYYDTICFTDIEAKMVRYYGEGTGQVLNLGSQPFLQYGLLSARERRAEAIAESITAMSYTPFHISLLPAFIALDLGDCISMTDDFSGNTSKGAVMEYTWTYNKSFSVYCYGDNPQLQAGQSKTDKDISGILNTTTQNEVTYYNFTNLDEIVIEPDIETTIANLSFTAAQTTTVKIMHEFLMDLEKSLSENSEYEIHYYLDGELVSYKPRESISGVSGSVTIGEDTYPVDEENVNIAITRDLFYVLRNVAPNIRHTWTVKILASGIESMTIGEENAHITIEGQRLYGSEHFDGLVEVREDISRIAIVGIGVKTLSESVIADNSIDSDVYAVSENITVYDLGAIGVTSLNEDIQIVKTWLPLASETHLVFQTEDGKVLRVQN